jgi:hypothetical protein
VLGWINEDVMTLVERDGEGDIDKENVSLFD